MILTFQEYTLERSMYRCILTCLSLSLSLSPYSPSLFLSRFESAQDILSDRSHVQYMKEKGLDLVPPDYDEYDDEYNDTYDSHDVGAGDQDSTEDLFPVKR